MTEHQLRKMQCYVANIAITPSALRNLGAGGLVQAAREFLGNLNLNPLMALDPSQYPAWLEEQTAALAAKFPVPHLWGPARKCINIFMTMALLNRFLFEAYALKRLENVLEVALDDIVQKKVTNFGIDGNLFLDGKPKWKSIKVLDSVNSEKLQKVAQIMADKFGIPRGQLDVELWEPA